MPLLERLQRLVEGVDTPIAAFASDGMFVGASEAARPLLGFRNLSEAGLDAARSDALKQGRVETPIGIGHMVLQRVGSGADVGLVALLAPGATQAAPFGHDQRQNRRKPLQPKPRRLAPVAEPAGRPIDELQSRDDVEPSAEQRRDRAPTDQHEPSPFVEAVADEPHRPAPNPPSSGPLARPVEAPSGSTSAARPAGIRCASCGRWTAKTASPSAPTNSAA